MYALATFTPEGVRYLTENSFGCKLTKKVHSTRSTLKAAQEWQAHYQKPNPHDPVGHAPFAACKIVDLSL